MSMENLLTETLAELSMHGKQPSDVRWVGVTGKAPMPCGTWEEFTRYADFQYDDGYGGAEVNQSLVIVGDDWWLERGEYDGSEWWEFKTLPTKAAELATLRPTDLREIW